jgi:secondary thiamine-phosphate synthase enzyme
MRGARANPRFGAGGDPVGAWRSVGVTVWIQREIVLSPRPRGFHLITREVADALPQLRELRVGLLHLLIRHTSASLALNENASPEVRRDFESWFDAAVPERAAFWTHTLEGPDDMPAHVKAALLGPSLTLPLAGGRLALGTWQGIYLCEHRDRGGPRTLVATAWGDSAPARAT